MRITGGILGGRIVKAPRSVLRPTQDRVREALFSVLGGRVAGSVFLDLFAGSGAVGLEAWSRGAGSVWWVESNRRILKCLKDNVQNLCVQGVPSTDKHRGVSVREGDAMRFLKKNVADRKFDIIFADPPYQRSEVRGQRSRGGGCEVLLKAIEDGGVLARGGVFVMEQAAETDSPAPENWLKTMEKVYGGTKLAFFEKEHAE